MKKIVLFLLVLIAVACGEDDRVKIIELDQEFTLEIGETGVVTEPEIRLQVLSTSDSRCPTNVICVWQGEAKVVFRFEMSDGLSVLDSLSTYDRLNTVINDISIQLVGVTPYPDGNNDKKDRTARLVMSQN